MCFHRFRLLLLLLASTCGPRTLPGDSLDPETERKTLQARRRLEINLFAADPMVEKPIEMNWDNRGRLWVATSETYPQVKPGEIPNDKIVILEDTTGTGKADKSTVFADGLFIPTAVVPGDGGAYVTNSTEIVHFDENPATGKAEHRRVVLAGFGTEDTHHIIHTLRWGSTAGSIGISRFTFTATSKRRTALSRCSAAASGGSSRRPKSSTSSAAGLVNPWGIVFDRWGRWFETDGAGGEGIDYSFPGAALKVPSGDRAMLPGLNPRQPEICQRGNPRRPAHSR